MPILAKACARTAPEGHGGRLGGQLSTPSCGKVAISASVPGFDAERLDPTT